MPQHRRMQTLPEIERKLENLIRLGSVAEVNPSTALCRVETGDITTNWLPWITQRAGSDRTWWPPSVGEQVVLLCPGGNPSNGLVLLGVFSDAHPAPASDLNTTVMALFRDGTRLSYDNAAHHLIADVRGDASLLCEGDLVATVGGDASMSVVGDLTAEAASADVTAATITLNGDVTINGSFTLNGALTHTGNHTTTGNVTVTGLVSANGVGLTTHTHISALPGTPTSTGAG